MENLISSAGKIGIYWENSYRFKMLLYFILLATFSAALSESCLNVCKKRETCCGTPDDRTCCPYSDGVCCDNDTCCPSGTVCDDDGLSCRAVISGELLTKRQGSDASEAEDNDQAKNFVHCGGIAYCVVNNTCCEVIPGHFGCCVFKSGVCCPNQLHCCQKGELCATDFAGCVKPSNED